MKCPRCGDLNTKVNDSRPSDDSQTIRRRRECTKCEYRFTTYERIEQVPIMVIKKNNIREPFNRDKLINGILRACEKRPVSLDKIEALVDRIEFSIQNSLKKEIKTSEIGEMLIDELKELDEIAYIRFASVYRQFKDVNLFVDEINNILKKKEN